MYMYVPVALYPSCLHTTPASTLSQSSSHTVPHSAFRQSWIVPSDSNSPFISLTCPSKHSGGVGDGETVGGETVGGAVCVCGGVVIKITAKGYLDICKVNMI